MDIFGWYQTAGAVFAGNMLTVAFLYFCWSGHQRQQKGLNPYDVGFWAILGGIAGPLVAIGGLWPLFP